MRFILPFSIVILSALASVTTARPLAASGGEDNDVNIPERILAEPKFYEGLQSLQSLVDEVDPNLSTVRADWDDFFDEYEKSHHDDTYYLENIRTQSEEKTTLQDWKHLLYYLNYLAKEAQDSTKDYDDSDKTHNKYIKANPHPANDFRAFARDFFDFDFASISMTAVPIPTTSTDPIATASVPPIATTSVPPIETTTSGYMDTTIYTTTSAPIATASVPPTETTDYTDTTTTYTTTYTTTSAPIATASVPPTETTDRMDTTTTYTTTYTTTSAPIATASVPPTETTTSETTTTSDRMGTTTTSDRMGTTTTSDRMGTTTTSNRMETTTTSAHPSIATAKVAPIAIAKSIFGYLKKRWESTA